MKTPGHIIGLRRDMRHHLIIGNEEFLKNTQAHEQTMEECEENLTARPPQAAAGILMQLWELNLRPERLSRCEAADFLKRRYSSTFWQRRS